MTPSDAQQALAHDAEQQRAKILAYEAGSELDCEVERQVFGHVVETSPATGQYMARYAPDHARWPNQGLGHVPPYSTEAGAAFLIVDEFARRHIPVSLYSMSHGAWFCFFGQTPIFGPGKSIVITHEARANAPAEAIAKAALLATLEARPR